jgi:hypothetical protein
MAKRQQHSQTRGRCPNCHADRNAEILADDTQEGEDPASGIWAKSSFSILRCLGCDNRYIRRVQACSEDCDPETGEIEEDVTFWPAHERRQRPRWFGEWSWLPDPDKANLVALLAEVYTAVDHNLCVLATIGMRTVFDCASVMLGADPHQPFSEKLRELVAGNKIGGEEKKSFRLSQMLEAQPLIAVGNPARSKSIL